MSCCSGSQLYGGKCCSGPGQPVSSIVTKIVANADLSQLGIYNFENFGAVANNHGLCSAAMASMFAAVSAANPVGGRCWFRQEVYPIDPIPGGYILPLAVVLEAAAVQAGTPSGAVGNGTQLLSMTGDGTLFLVTGAHNSGGVYLEKLAMSVGPNPATLNTTMAINCTNGWGITARDCNFQNFPMVMKANALAAGLDHCAIQYYAGPNGDGPGGSHGNPGQHVGLVRLSAAEVFVRHCDTFLQQPISGGGAPTGIVGISIESGADHHRVDSVHINHFDWGISYGLNSAQTINHGRFRDLKIDSFSGALWMETSTAGGQIYDEKYTSCAFALGDSTTNTGPVVFLGTNGGANNTLDQIDFVDPSIYQGLGDGFEFNRGQNLRITSGFIAGNGTTAAGFAITGAAGDCTLNDVGMIPSFTGALNLQSQKYAMRIAAGAGYVGSATVRGCNWTGYTPSITPNDGNGPLFVGAGGIGTGTLRVNLTKGYNDLIGLSIGVAPTTGSPASAASRGFWGPTRLSAQGPTQFYLNGVTRNLAAGGSFSITLDPYDMVGLGGSPTNVTWNPVWG